MAGARAAIGAGRFADYRDETKEQWVAKGDVARDLSAGDPDTSRI